MAMAVDAALQVGPAKINFVRTDSTNYEQVQNQLLDSIQKHLEPGEYSETMTRRAEGALNFSLFIHQPADVIMSHGAADKNYFFRKDEHGERISNRLKHVFVPGPWLKRRLVRSKHLALTEDQVHSVGWPRLDKLLRKQAKFDLARPEREPGDRKVILWAPTHDFRRRGEENLSTSSYPEFLEFVPALEEHFDVHVSLHPRNRRNKKPTADSLIEADYVISDFGTLVYEAWALGKPVLFPYWIIGERLIDHLGSSAEAKIFREQIGLHPKSFAEMIDMLHAGPTLDETVTGFLNDYLDPKYKGKSGRRVARLLRKLSAEAFAEAAHAPAI